MKCSGIAGGVSLALSAEDVRNLRFALCDAADKLNPLDGYAVAIGTDRVAPLADFSATCKWFHERVGTTPPSEWMRGVHEAGTVTMTATEQGELLRLCAYLAVSVYSTSDYGGLFARLEAALLFAKGIEPRVVIDGADMAQAERAMFDMRGSGRITLTGGGK